MNIAMNDKEISQLVISEFQKKWNSQWLTPKKINLAKESWNEWVSLQTTDNHWKAMPWDIKVLCDKIIACSETSFSAKQVNWLISI